MDTNTKKRFIIRISILAVVFAAGIFGLYVYSGYLKNRSEYLAKKELADEVDSYADVAYPGKNLADTDLSGLSEDEITRILLSLERSRSSTSGTSCRAPRA